MRLYSRDAIAAVIGPIGVIVLTITPIFLIPLADRFTTGSGILLNIGRIAGLAGMTLFSLALILSARFAFLEIWFGGLDRMYRMHHRMGVIAFLLLLIHPLTLVASYLPTSFTYATSLLIPGSDWAINYGLLALVGMIMLIILAVFADSFTFLPYQFLKRSHSFFGIFFFFAFLHTMLIPSDVSRNYFLKSYFILLSSAAIASYVYRTLGGKFWIKRYAYRVQEIRRPINTITEIRMLPYGKAFKYKPGQFIFIHFEGENISREVHPFSLSSTPYEHEISITVKALGSYTAQLANLQQGTVAKIEGPYGRFSFLNAPTRKQVWIAGGIGITPFLSMARTLTHLTGSAFEIDLYCCAKTWEEMFYLPELEHIVKLYPSLRVFSFYSNTSDYLTVDALVKQSGSFADKAFFLCGPPAMMRNLHNQLKKIGVPKHLLHNEAFQLL